MPVAVVVDVTMQVQEEALAETVAAVLENMKIKIMQLLVQQTEAVAVAVPVKILVVTKQVVKV
jgi:hypothetical protein